MSVDAVPAQLLQEPAMLDAVKSLGCVGCDEGDSPPLVSVGCNVADSIEQGRLRGVSWAETVLFRDVCMFSRISRD